MIKTMKPLIVLVLLLWLLECVNIWTMRDLEYHPMPGQYQFTIKNNLEEEK